MQDISERLIYCPNGSDIFSTVLKLNLVVHLSVPLSFEQIKFSGGPKITPSNPGKSVLD